MHESSFSPTDAAERLAAALRSHDDVACGEAEALIPRLIEAERAGIDVDREPIYAAILQHLDHCEDCLNLYEQLVDDLEAVISTETELSAVQTTAPVFFLTPISKGDDVLLHVVKGAIRRFRLTFEIPRLAPTPATLSSPQRTIFSDTLPEVTGAPLLALTAARNSDGILLQVAVRDPNHPTAWQLRLETDDRTLTATTDRRGIARFTLPLESALQKVHVYSEELPIKAQDE